MASTAAPRLVQHCPKSLRFFIELEKSPPVCAELLYKKLRAPKTHSLSFTPAGLLDFWHTETPPQYQGQGLARILADEAFQYALDNKFLVKPSCTYIQAYAQKTSNQAFKDITQGLSAKF